MALIVYAVLLALIVAFGGLLINAYAYEAMMKICWRRVNVIDCDWTVEGCVALTGDGVLKYYSMENRSALGDSIILLTICFALFFVAFWFLLAMASKRVSASSGATTGVSRGNWAVASNVLVKPLPLRSTL
jgi:hypothetical protein